MLAGLVVGLIVSGWILAVLLTLATPLVATKYLTFRTGRRRAAFADQLDDSLQLLR
jgi:tight adherence protein B